jgi:hypothetical protein
MTHVYTVNGDDTQLITTKNEIRRLEQEVGIPSNTAKAERDLSIQQFKQGSKSEALQHAENAFALFEEQGDKYDLTFFKSDVAHALRQSEDLTRALSYYRQSILLWQDFGHRAAVAHQLECFALIALAQ